MSPRIVLLHLSDIHFQLPDCDTDADPNAPIRTRLLNDVRDRVRETGPITAILVTGDIAFKGDPGEYLIASRWLGKLASVAQCRPENVLTVPGNHDVDRRLISANVNIQNVQQAIMAHGVAADREGALRRQLYDAEAGQFLLKPIEAYNRFAARFDCHVHTPQRLFWTHEMPLDTDITLRIYGLTSTLLSGAGASHAQEDLRHSLYVSPLQMAFQPDDGVINLVMCHHPPDWLWDGDQLDDALKQRVAIHLFGHKHRQRQDLTEAYVRLGAGAVNPDRYGPEWEPSYNLIVLSVLEADRRRFVDVALHLRRWQHDPEQFVPVFAQDGSLVFRKRLPLRGADQGASGPPRTSNPSTTAQNSSAHSDQAVELSVDPPLEAAMNRGDIRNLVYRFWNLTASERRDIIEALGIYEPADSNLPEVQRYSRALARARARNLIERLAAEIADRE